MTTASPQDWRDGWIYFLLVDRFDNPAAPPRFAWDQPCGTYQGGTLDGVRRRLGYIRDLGATAIWLSPVLQNPASDDGAYHGYGIQDFTRVEARFCADVGRARNDPAYADQQLRDLVDDAHALGLAVVLDVVINHSGDVFSYDGYGSVAPWRDEPPYGIHWREGGVGPPGLFREDVFRRRGNAFDAPGHDPTAAGDFWSLKEMVTSERATDGRFPVRDVLVDLHADLVHKFDIDGFRIDTLMYVERDFALTFGNAVREHAQMLGKRNFFTFGEVYADEERISSYVGRRTGDGDLIGVDAALDFPLFYRLPGVAKGLVPPTALVDTFALRRRLQEGVVSSHGDASRYFVTFLDNHDQHRRIRYEDPVEPGRFDQQVGVALTLLFTLQGIPCVYYGTEAGLAGAGSAPEAVREALWGAPGAFDLTATSFAGLLRTLSAVRAAHAALRYGRQYFRPVSGDSVHFGHSPFAGGVVAFSRILAATEVLVVAATGTVGFSGEVVVDANLTAPGTQLNVVYGNRLNPAAPGAAVRRTAVVIGESAGDATVVPVQLRANEVLVLSA